jgi:tRNA (mo5U34)-methyltransferase
MQGFEEAALGREWFYEFTLPSGAVTKAKVPRSILHIHSTRLQMMWGVVDPFFGEGLARATAIDAASHEGYFSLHLAQRCAAVRGIEVHPQNFASANLIRDIYGLSNLEFINADLESMNPSTVEPADLVLAFGLIYHVENPLRMLRTLSALTRRLLLIETQTVMLELSGAIDWGHHTHQTPLRGIFGIVDEMAAAPEGGTSNLALVPSRDGLVWILNRLGFKRIEIVPVPADGYPQLVSGRRIMVAAYV